MKRNLPVVEKSSAEKRSHPCTKPERPTVLQVVRIVSGKVVVVVVVVVVNVVVVAVVVVNVMVFPPRDIIGLLGMV